MLVVSAIMLFLCHLRVGSKGHESGDNWNVREFLLWFSIWSEARFVTVYAAREIFIQTHVAQTRIWAAIIDLGLKAGEVVDTRSNCVEFQEGRILRKCEGELFKCSIGRVCLQLIREGLADSEIVSAKLLSYERMHE
jgi:hypothetical protein